MITDRLHAATSKRLTAWSAERSLPGYWTALQVLLVVGFVVVVVWQLLSGPAPAAPVAEPEFTYASDPVTVDPVTADPVAPVPDGAGTVDVIDGNGGQVAVPAGAAALAQAAFAGAFDPQVAAQVPLVGGGTLVAGREFPDATVGTLVLTTTGEQSWTFSAATDADGAGTTFGSVTSSVTVVFDGTTWLVDRG